MIEQDRNAFKHISPCHIPCNSNITTSSVLPHGSGRHQEISQHQEMCWTEAEEMRRPDALICESDPARATGMCCAVCVPMLLE